MHESVVNHCQLSVMNHSQNSKMNSGKATEFTRHPSVYLVSMLSSHDVKQPGFYETLHSFGFVAVVGFSAVEDNINLGCAYIYIYLYKCVTFELTFLNWTNTLLITRPEKLLVTFLVIQCALLAIFIERQREREDTTGGITGHPLSLYRDALLR